jgi:hypothetical protein
MTMVANVDDSTASLINVTDPNAPTVFNGQPTVAAGVIWSATGLASGPHTLVLSDANSMDGYHDMNIDAFM